MAFNKFGWNRGVREAQRQVRHCIPDYQMNVGIDGCCNIVTANGLHIKHADINPALLTTPRWRIESSFIPK